MKLGEKVCSMLDCPQCPFNKQKLLKVCTGFKLRETLYEGLEAGKKILGDLEYERIKSKLDKPFTMEEAR